MPLVRRQTSEHGRMHDRRIDHLGGQRDTVVIRGLEPKNRPIRCGMPAGLHPKVGAEIGLAVRAECAR